jgi:hypothetical protein
MEVDETFEFKKPLWSPETAIANSMRLLAEKTEKEGRTRDMWYTLRRHELIQFHSYTYKSLGRCYYDFITLERHYPTMMGVPPTKADTGHTNNFLNYFYKNNLDLLYEFELDDLFVNLDSDHPSVKIIYDIITKNPPPSYVLK